MAKGAENDLTTPTEVADYSDALLFKDVAQAAVRYTPGLVPGAVENSLNSVMELADGHNPNLAIALRGVLGAVMDYDQAASAREAEESSAPWPEQPPTPPAQLINPLDTRLGGM
jgi:hypothetical protein